MRTRADPDGRPRRILHLIPRCIGGGPERSVLAVAQETAALGVEHRHTLAVLDPPVTPAMVLQARRAGVALAIAPDPGELCRLVAESDVVQVDYWNHPALTACLRAIELPPTRVLVWCHVLGTHAPQVLTADIARFADQLVVTSEQSRAAEGCRAVEADGTPLAVIPGVIDRHRLEGYAPRPHDGCVVGFVGNLNESKLHPRFAELCAAVTDPTVRFVVYGGGGTERELARELAAVGIADRVDLRGPTEDVRAAFGEMDVFGYPLTPEAWATSEMVLQEAMWVGLPAVVFAHGGPATMVADGTSGLVVRDERGYAHAVDRLAADASLRARLADGARRHARRAFDPARNAAMAVDVVESLLACPRRVRPSLPGRDDTPGAGFVRSLGDQAGAFAVSLAGSEAHADALMAADREIMASTLAARAEGGVIHHRNTYPDDPHLRLWSGLIAAGAGDRGTAREEYRAAAALGLGDDRPARYTAGL